MKQIHFDPTNQEAMNALMDEHGKSKTMYPGTNEHGESVYISIRMLRKRCGSWPVSAKRCSGRRRMPRMLFPQGILI